MRFRNRLATFVLLTGTTLLGIQPTPEASDQSSRVTFNKDVLPILQENCQACHRPGGIAPMSLMTYESARPWAKAIRSAVISKQMPPWFADSQYAEFRNAPKITPADRTTLVAWVDAGAQEGDVVDKPLPTTQWADGWRIQPDVVVEMQAAHRIPAKGPGEIREFIIPSPFKEDTWVTSIEIRPGDPSVVHHVIVQVPRPPLPVTATAPCGDCLLDLPDDQDDLLKYLTALAALRGNSNGVNSAVDGFVSQPLPAAGEISKSVNIVHPAADGFNTSSSIRGGAYSGSFSQLSPRERQTGLGEFMTMDAVYAPGSQPLDFGYTGSAKLIPGGAPIHIEVHYTPNGTETSDKTMVGFTLAKSPAQRRFVIMAPEHLADMRKPIPAGAASWETKGELTFTQDADLVWFMPHMHLRGKDMTFQLIHTDGREETVLHAAFNFNWQLGYELAHPIKVTKGTRMVVTAHHDNSANNRANPVPNVSVNWGEMTTEEMMLPWFGVVVDRDVQPDSIASYRPGSLDVLPPAPADGANRKTP